MVKSSTVCFLSALWASAGSAGGAAWAAIGTMIPTLAATVAPSSPTTTLRTFTSVDVTGKSPSGRLSPSAERTPLFGAHVNVCKRIDAWKGWRKLMGDGYTLWFRHNVKT